MKKSLLTILIFIVILTFIASYYVLNYIFPKANKIQSPEIEEILSVTVMLNNSDKVTTIVNSDFERLVLSINNAHPTRKQSINDSPTIKTYYTVIIETDEKKYHYFVYEEDSQVYIEIPYEGIYRSDYPILDVIMKYDDKKYSKDTIKYLYIRV